MHGPAEKLKKLIKKSLYINTVHENRITRHAFDKLTKVFIMLYCNSTVPKGDVIEYLKSKKYLKPKDRSVCNHQNRMVEIIRYSTYLE